MANTIGSSLFSSSLSSSSLSDSVLYASRTQSTKKAGSIGLTDLLNMQYGSKNSAASKTAADSATNMDAVTTGSDIRAAIMDLTTKNRDSLFIKMIAKSTQDSAATATVDASKIKDVWPPPMFLDIAQLAQTQVNSGDAVEANGKDVAQNTYAFSVQVGDKQNSFSVYVSAKDDNEAIQKKMASAINDAKIGVTASVSYNTTDETTKLSLESAASGKTFTVTDTTGDLASKTGVTTTSQQAQNASYSVNGGDQQTSTSNKVDLGNGVTATLKSSNASTTLSFQKDGTDAVQKVKDLVGSLNQALTDANAGSGRGSDRLSRDVSVMNTAYSSSLSRVGINVNQDGTLAIDTDKLKKASTDGSLQKLFEGNKNAGFANRADRIASDLKTTNYYADSVLSQKSTRSSASQTTGSLFSAMF